jgi:hypothetical protein
MYEHPSCPACTPVVIYVAFSWQGLIANKEGAILRQVGKAGPGAPDAAWRILYKVGADKFVQVGDVASRLEL